MADKKKQGTESNIDQKDRGRGGQKSAREQSRDDQGQFAGKDRSGDDFSAGDLRGTNHPQQNSEEEGRFISDEEGMRDDDEAANMDVNAEERLRKGRGPRPM